MFGKRFHLFTLFGFRVSLDSSWLVLAVLVTWTLAAGYFPAAQPGLAPRTYWLMGAAGAIGLFVSIVIHEFFHAIVARRYDIPMRGITLFIFGGVAEMESEPPTAKSEFLMAAAGPLASFGLAALFHVVARALTGAIPVGITTVVGYLAYINLVLAIFNLIPAFPLDGGRILRAALWHKRGNLRSATQTVARIGSGFGFVLMALGVISFIGGAIVPGIWQFVLGMFLRGLASASYQQVVLREALAGEPVRRFMTQTPVAVPRSLTVDALVDDYVYRHHFKLFPVVEDGRLMGCVSTREIKEVPRDMWPFRTVGDIATGCNAVNTISPDTDALEALRRMRTTGASRLLVADRGTLVGVLSLKDLLQYLALKMELES